MIKKFVDMQGYFYTP